MKSMEEPLIGVDKIKVEQSFSKHWDTYDEHAAVQAEIARFLCEEFLKIQNQKNLGKVLEIGCGSGFLTRELFSKFNLSAFYANDLCGCLEKRIVDLISPDCMDSFLAGDIEKIALPKGLNHVFSASTLQWIQDLDGLFYKIHQALNPNGYLVFNSFGPNNYREIRETTGNGLDYLSVEEVKLKLEIAGFEVDYAEVSRVLYFPDVSSVFKHLKLTGVNGLKSRAWTKEGYKQLISSYETKFQTEKGLSLSYHPILFWARKKM